MDKQKLTAYFTEREALAVENAAKKSGVNKSDFIVRATLDAMARKEIQETLADVRHASDELVAESRNAFASLSGTLDARFEEEMRKFKGQLAVELDHHLKRIADMFKTFEQTGKAPRPKGAGIDINNM